MSCAFLVLANDALLIAAGYLFMLARDWFRTNEAIERAFASGYKFRDWDIGRTFLSRTYPAKRHDE